ncbi:O-acyltransferase like protein-like [Homarus americanus]|uniref:O-acyltransferase like protein-like n=2 Tax=Homarus americanus TaxID=6706 RepID=A0A8J5JTL8_HOMAM|nr:O-acyltransferase like protein-like [Homarus americanus]
MTPWCRANSYLVGVWAGLLLFTVQGKILRMKLWQAILGWLLSAAVALAVLYGMADYDTLEDPVLLPVAPSIIYAGFSRASWCAALVWVVFACHTGYGGPINTFLSHPSWQPMSRLTFAMYLTCFPIQIIYPGLIYIPFYINHLNSVLLTCGFLFIGGIAAVLLSLMVEGPILGLEKILLKRPGRGIKEPETTTTQRT